MKGTTIVGAFNIQVDLLLLVENDCELKALSKLDRGNYEGMDESSKRLSNQ